MLRQCLPAAGWQLAPGLCCRQERGTQTANCAAGSAAATLNLYTLLLPSEELHSICRNDQLLPLLRSPYG